MAEIELFHYRKGNGYLHFMDTRIKLLIILLLSISTFNSGTTALLTHTTLTTAIFVVEFKQTGILSPFKFIKNVKFFLIFLILIILIRGFTTEGTQIPFISFISIEGLQLGALYSWKLFIILIISQLLTSTTDPSNIQGAIHTILKPIPFIRAGQIATMISLTITFIPLLFDQFLEVRNASYSRLGNRSGNPVKKISSMVLPLLQTTIFRADEIAQAMESRCYTENPTPPEMRIKKSDIISLIFIFLLITTLFLFA